MYSDIEFKMLQHGHRKKYKIINPSKPMLMVLKELSKLKVEDSSIRKSTLKDSLKDSEDFMKSHFNIHKIPCQTADGLRNFISARKDLSVSEMLNEYNEFGIETDPYKLPISLENQDFWYGRIGELGINYAIEEFLVEAKVIFSEIFLSEKMTNVTPRIISHEVTHSQLNSRKGSIQSYYNYEVLSIFIEYLHSIECDSSSKEFNLEKTLRYLSIAEDIMLLEEYNKKSTIVSPRNAVIHTMYLESEMKAIQLLEIYLQANPQIKKYILDYIQKIFDNEKTVEELLERFNITLEESSNYLKNKIFIKEKRG